MTELGHEKARRRKMIMRKIVLMFFG